MGGIKGERKVGLQRCSSLYDRASVLDADVFGVWSLALYVSRLFKCMYDSYVSEYLFVIIFISIPLMTSRSISKRGEGNPSGATLGRKKGT